MVKKPSTAKQPPGTASRASTAKPASRATAKAAAPKSAARAPATAPKAAAAGKSKPAPPTAAAARASSAKASAAKAGAAKASPLKASAGKAGAMRMNAGRTTGGKAAEAPATVTLKHLVARIAEDHEMAKRQADAVVSDLIGMMVDHLKNGDRVRIGGLGILQVRHRAERMGRNPATGEAMRIKASRKIGFRAAKELKEAI